VSDTEALLLLIGVPAVVVAVIWALAWRGGPSADKRYRPGRPDPFEFAPVWYLANHRTGPATAAPALGAATDRRALPSGADRGDRPASGEVAEESSHGAVGGASDRW
jgi:hypothetical protein